MQQINLNIKDNYLEEAMIILDALPKNKVKVMRVIPNKSAFGLLNGKIKDPVKWQKELRSNNDSDLY